MERRELLELIYQSIQDKSRIVFSKRVSNVSTFDTFAIISATDGSQVRCDFVAGADGVRSVVRDAIVRETLNYQVPLKCMLKKKKLCLLSGSASEILKAHLLTGTAHRFGIKLQLRLRCIKCPSADSSRPCY